MNGKATYARVSTLQGKLETSAHLSALQGKAPVWHLLRKYDTIIFPRLGCITWKRSDFFSREKKKMSPRTGIYEILPVELYKETDNSLVNKMK